MTQLVIFMVLCITSVFGGHDKYEGHQLYRVSGPNEEIGALEPHLDFLSVTPAARASSGKLEALVRLAPQEKAKWLQYFDQKQMTYTKIADNLADILRDEESKIQMARSAAKRSGKSMSWDTYYTYEEINDYLDELGAAYPGLVTVVDAALSYEGRQIKYLKISTTQFQDPRKPVIVIDAMVHSNEWLTTPIALYLVNHLLNFTSVRLTHEIDWVIIPLANPDGYVYSWEEDRMWRKTRSRGHDGADECPGVDGNRNFDHFWGTSNDTANPCTRNYHGPSLYSEVEMRVIRDAVLDHMPRIPLYISVHTWGSMVLYAWGQNGQQKKSTYLLLGNVSLADTIIGFSLIFRVTVDNPVSSNPLCIFQTGMLVCPAMVSIFSVGLIAVDRYIYILHGLYYPRWFNTSRVRIGIIIIWMIGLTLGFMPATGWINTELIFTRCSYVFLFPGSLVLLNSVLSIIPIAVVAVLYTRILVQALKTARTIDAGVKNLKANTTSPVNLTMRVSRGSKPDTKITTQSVKVPENCLSPKLTRSLSFHVSYKHSEGSPVHSLVVFKSKSIDDLVNNNMNKATSFTKSAANVADNEINGTVSIDKSMDNVARPPYTSNSVLSVCTVESNYSDENSAITDLRNSKFCIQMKKICTRNKTVPKPSETNKWRAITIVMLTTGSFVITWLPYFIAVIFFVFCEDKIMNPKCLTVRHLLFGPLATLAFINSILNPLIYAWWHKGFQESVRNYYRKYIQHQFCQINRHR